MSAEIAFLKGTGGAGFERKHAGYVDVFTVPATNHAGKEPGYRLLKSGFQEAGFQQTMVNWKNGNTTTVSEQAEYLYETIRNSRSARIPFAPITLAGFSRGTTVVMQAAEMLKSDPKLNHRLVPVFFFLVLPLTTNPYFQILRLMWTNIQVITQNILLTLKQI